MGRLTIGLCLFLTRHAVGGWVFALILAFAFSAQAQDGMNRQPNGIVENAPEFSPPVGQFDCVVRPTDGTIAGGQVVPVDHLARQSAAEATLFSPQMAEVARTDCWHWQVTPDGLIYRSYLAGVKEPRLAARWVHKADQGWIWDVTLGGRVGLVRYGTANPSKPEGWQLDVEGAAMGRLDLEADSNALQATDYRVGVPLTYGRGAHQTKLAFYHISSHLGDELMLQQPAVPRINYVRDAIVWGHSYCFADDVRVYGEIAWAFNVDGGAKPWEFQFGTEYSPTKPTGARPVPFYAINANLREEVDFGGNVTFQVGLQWLGITGRRMRVGMQYFTGKSDQYEFFDRFEDKIGVAVWYDF